MKIPGAVLYMFLNSLPRRGSKSGNGMSALSHVDPQSTLTYESNSGNAHSVLEKKVSELESV
jgi:hypothetical protein